MITEKKKQFSQKLKDIKKLTGWNQNQLAYILKTTKQNVSRWINLTHLPEEQSEEVINKLYDQVTKEYGEIKHSED